MPRLIHGVGRIVADAIRMSVKVYWCLEPMPALGYTYRRERVILLSPDLLWGWPWVFRKTFGHENGHVEVGLDEDVVDAWTDNRYGELVNAPQWGYR